MELPLDVWASVAEFLNFTGVAALRQLCTLTARLHHLSQGYIMRSWHRRRRKYSYALEILFGEYPGGVVRRKNPTPLANIYHPVIIAGFELCNNDPAMIVLRVRMYSHITLQEKSIVLTNMYDYAYYIRHEPTFPLIIHPRGEVDRSTRYVLLGFAEPWERPTPVVGGEVDVLDASGVWYNGRFVHCLGDGRWRVHYGGWDPKWDDVFSVDSAHLAPRYRHVQRWYEHLRPGDPVEVCRKTQDKVSRWYPAIILNRRTLGLTLQLDNGMIYSIPTRYLEDMVCPRGVHVGREPYQRAHSIYQSRFLSRLSSSPSASGCEKALVVRIAGQESMLSFHDPTDYV